jgi:hypothetical protein
MVWTKTGPLDSVLSVNWVMLQVLCPDTGCIDSNPVRLGRQSRSEARPIDVRRRCAIDETKTLALPANYIRDVYAARIIPHVIQIELVQDSERLAGGTTGWPSR